MSMMESIRMAPAVDINDGLASLAQVWAANVPLQDVSALRFAVHQLDECKLTTGRAGQFPLFFLLLDSADNVVCLSL